VEFDEQGNLKPYKLREANLVSFEENFVAFFPNSSTRARLFSEFLDYLTKLNETIGTGYTQWIDGSYITKKLNPRDIDFVTFVDFNTYQLNESCINQLRELRDLGKTGMDGYFVQVYPANHPKRFLYEANKIQWLYQFGRSRNDSLKGIIEIKH
jgi:hypothetical protein